MARVGSKPAKSCQNLWCMVHFLFSGMKKCIFSQSAFFFTSLVFQGNPNSWTVGHLKAISHVFKDYNILMGNFNLYN
jgi:hypothetical protein